jgi:hypothetical protein
MQNKRDWVAMVLDRSNTGSIDDDFLATGAL